MIFLCTFCYRLTNGISYASIKVSMVLLSKIFGLFIKSSRKTRKTIKDYQNELFIKQGQEQFKKLLKLGSMPITFL